MLEKLTYEEILEFISEDFSEFLGDGLNVRQATSRVLVEYANQIDDYEDVAWMIYVILADLNVRYGVLRDDIKAEALAVIESQKLVDHWINSKVSLDEVHLRIAFLEKIKASIIEFDAMHPEQ